MMRLLGLIVLGVIGYFGYTYFSLISHYSLYDETTRNFIEGPDIFKELLFLLLPLIAFTVILVFPFVAIVYHFVIKLDSDAIIRTLREEKTKLKNDIQKLKEKVSNFDLDKQEIKISAIEEYKENDQKSAMQYLEQIKEQNSQIIKMAEELEAKTIQLNNASENIKRRDKKINAIETRMARMSMRLKKIKKSQQTQDCTSVGG